MPHRLLALSAALAGALSVVPAHAGSPEDPEVQGGCSRSEQATISVGGEHVVCSAWSTTAAGEQARLTGTTRTAGDLSQRAEPVRVALTWQREVGCREGWVFSDRLDAPDQLEVQRSCPGQEPVRADLDPARARSAGRDLAVELTDADLSLVGSGLARGDRLRRPVAYSMLLARSEVAGAELATGIVDTGPGRDHVVGS